MKLDDLEKRIYEIIKDAELGVNKVTLTEYREFLKKNLEEPVLLTGIEDFPWEERYLFGYGNKSEYEALKRKHPSYTDQFELLEIQMVNEEEEDLYVKVKRTRDKKRFVIKLSELESVDKKSYNYLILDDFSIISIAFCAPF